MNVHNLTDIVEVSQNKYNSFSTKFPNIITLQIEYQTHHHHID